MLECAINICWRFWTTFVYFLKIMKLNWCWWGNKMVSTTDSVFLHLTMEIGNSTYSCFVIVFSFFSPLIFSGREVFIFYCLTNDFKPFSMFLNILIFPIFCNKPEVYLRASWTSWMELFYKNSYIMAKSR